MPEGGIVGVAKTEKSRKGRKKCKTKCVRRKERLQGKTTGGELGDEAQNRSRGRLEYGEKNLRWTLLDPRRG